jgi:sporulation protein YlmC with PRC-barrel domain
MGYYGLASYWGAPPEVGVPPQSMSVEQSSSEVAEATGLMYAGEIEGYELDAQGERIGTVRDVLIELDTWKVTSLMADLGGLFTPDSANIAIAPVTGIDRAKRIVHIALPKEVVDRSHRTGLEDLPYVFPYVPPIA